MRRFKRSNTTLITCLQDVALLHARKQVCITQFNGLCLYLFSCNLSCHLQSCLRRLQWLSAHQATCCQAACSHPTIQLSDIRLDTRLDTGLDMATLTAYQLSSAYKGHSFMKQSDQQRQGASRAAAFWQLLDVLMGCSCNYSVTHVLIWCYQCFIGCPRPLLCVMQAKQRGLC